MNLSYRKKYNDIPKDVWNKAATDLFVCRNKLYVIVTDYTSKYLELAQLPNISSDTKPIREVYFDNMGYPK